MDQDPFEILGLKPGFNLDPEEIEAHYLERLAETHPDIAQDPAAGEVLAARLNEARETLEDPQRRARALLARLTGGRVPESRALPRGFLESILMIREEIEDAVARGDAGEKARHLAWAHQRRAEHIARIDEAFARASSPPPAPAVAAILEELNAWRYIERLIDQVSSQGGAYGGSMGQAP